MNSFEELQTKQYPIIMNLNKENNKITKIKKIRKYYVSENILEYEINFLDWRGNKFKSY